MKVRVAHMPGKPKVIDVPEGTTAEKALEAGGFKFQRGLEIRINGEPGQSGQFVQEGDRVFLVGDIEGN